MTNIYKRIPLTKEGVARYRGRIVTASASPSLNGWEMAGATRFPGHVTLGPGRAGLTEKSTGAGSRASSR